MDDPSPALPAVIFMPPRPTARTLNRVTFVALIRIFACCPIRNRQPARPGDKPQE